MNINPLPQAPRIDWVLARRLVAAIMDASRPWLALFDNNPELLVLWHTLRLSGTTADGGGASISGRAVSLALGQPYGTVRDRLEVLIAEGRCRKTRTGVRAAIPPTQSPAFQAATDHAVEVFNALIVTMARETLSGASSHAPGALEIWADQLAGVDHRLLEKYYPSYALRVVQASFSEFERSGVDAMIFNTVIGLNGPADAQVAAHPAYDGSASRMRCLADRLGLPFETVRRRVNRMIADGILERRPEGVAVPEAMRHAAPFERQALVIVSSFYQMQRSLAAEIRCSAPLAA